MPERRSVTNSRRPGHDVRGWRKTADRIFYSALAFNGGLTFFWVVRSRPARLAVLP